MTKSQKRRLRRKKLQSSYIKDSPDNIEKKIKVPQNITLKCRDKSYVHSTIVHNSTKDTLEMSSKEVPNKSREEVLAAREAKKLAKLKVKNKTGVNDIKDESLIKETKKVDSVVEKSIKTTKETDVAPEKTLSKSKDEVDRAICSNIEIKTNPNADIKEDGKDREQIKNERAAKKAAKQSKKKASADYSSVQPSKITTEVSASSSIIESQDTHKHDMTVKDVVDTLKDIVNVAKEVKEVTAKVEAIDLSAKKVILK